MTAVPNAPDAPAGYPLGYSPAERDRLQRQASELREDSVALLDRVVVGTGWSAVDLGCGPRGILDLLAERVGPAGRVTGLDCDPATAVAARRFAMGRGLANVQVVRADARRTGLPGESYDLVHARTLLVNVPDPAAVTAEMARIARPGGWVAALEPDAGVSVCYPPHPAWDRMADIWRAAHQARGLDVHLGRRLPVLFRRAGLAEVGVEARAAIYPPGHSRRTVRLDLLRSMRPAIIEAGIAGPGELDEIDRALRRHLDDPATVMLPNLLFLTWGRKSVTTGSARGRR